MTRPFECTVILVCCGGSKTPRNVFVVVSFEAVETRSAFVITIAITLTVSKGEGQTILSDNLKVLGRNQGTIVFAVVSPALTSRDRLERMTFKAMKTRKTVVVIVTVSFAKSQGER